MGQIEQGDQIHSSRPELRALTGLRGVAATIVALAHFQQLLPGYADAPFMWHNAVDLFFCLSGFTLSYVYRRDGFQFSGYLLARIARIYPLYFFALVVAGGTVVLPLMVNPVTYPASAAFSDLLLQLLMLNSWPVIGSGVHWSVTAWSISVEWFCYLLLFPFLLFQNGPSSTPRRLLCIVVLSAASYSMFVHFFDGNLSTPELYVPKNRWSYWVSLLRGISSFTAGWVMFTSFDKRDGLHGFCTKYTALIWSGVILDIVLAYCGVVHSQAMIFLCPFVVLAATDPTSVTSHLLESKALHFLGVISYSIYMTHFVVFIAFMRAFHAPPWSPLIYALVLAMTFVISIGTYFLIEVPARNALRAGMRTRRLAM
jgi:peptidoglycan/LPS O-acetylase OafA/YrhL